MKNQKGSAHLIIIILLTIAVLGLVGFMFWQKFIATNVNTSDVSHSQSVSDTSQSKSVALSENKVITDSGVSFSFNYPKGWTINNEDETLTSPDKSIAYNYSFRGIGGIGGTCGDYESVKTTSLVWESVPVKKDVIFAQYSQKSVQHGSTYYDYGFGLYSDPDNSIKNAIKTNPDCILPVYSTFIKTGVLEAVTNAEIAATFIGNFKNIDTNNATQEQINAAFLSDTFAVAKRIAESVTIKP